jgi:hypothetical protein
MRRRLSYANVVATLALVFAMSGGAMAAKHYMINSTSQINPKVLKKLKGNSGRAGSQGAAGATGKEGLAGKDGKTGPEGPPGKPGSARAFAAISSNGVLDTARSKNIESVKLESAGIYCIKLSAAAGTDGNSTAPVATPDAGGADGFVEGINAYVETNPATCAASEIEVLLRQVTVSGGTKSESSKDSDFTVVVP